MKNIFLCDGYSTYSHSFLRADFDSLGNYELLDIGVYPPRLFDMIRPIFIVVLIRLIYLLGFYSFVFSSYRSKLQLIKVVLIYLNVRKTIDLSSVTNIRCHFLSKASFLALLLRRRGVHFTVVCHAADLYGCDSAKLKVLECSDVVETISHFGKGFAFALLKERAIGRVVFKPNKVRHIFNGINSKARASAKVIRLICVARLVPQKGLLELIEVMTYLTKLCQGRHVHLDLYGDGPLRQLLLEKIELNDLGQNITMHGSIPADRVLGSLRESDAFILLPAEVDFEVADGIPVVYQEALMCGLPVITSDAFGVSEYVWSRVNGLVLETSAAPESKAKQIALFLLDAPDPLTFQPAAQRYFC